MFSSVFDERFSLIGKCLRFVSRNGITFLAVHIYILEVIKACCLNWDANLINQFITLVIMLLVTILSVPLFATKLHYMIGKDKAVANWIDCFKVE